MTREEMEFLISQHLDGTLSHEEEAKVRELLDLSAEARGILDDYLSGHAEFLSHIRR